MRPVVLPLGEYHVRKRVRHGEFVDGGEGQVIGAGGGGGDGARVVGDVPAFGFGGETGLGGWVLDGLLGGVGEGGC